MGFFSWRSAGTNKSIFVGFKDVVAIFPDNSIKRGCYDGYGRILGPNENEGCPDENADVHTMYGQFIKEGMKREECFENEHFSKINGMIKIVEGWYYDAYRPRYENLPVSENCKYQGFFYSHEVEDEMATEEPFLIHILEEEIVSLLEGKNIELQESPEIILLGKESKIGEDKVELIKEILKSTDLEFNNMVDILDRYNNQEYWDPELPIN